MSNAGKKHTDAKKKLASTKITDAREALQFIVSNAHVKFDETVDVSIALGIDPLKGEQTVRGSVLLPHGTGKKLRVIVFTKGTHEDEAKKAGADFVGAEDLVEKILAGWMEFDMAVATPDMMGIVGKVAKILGPRGLLPNKKLGTVTFDVAGIVSDLKKGRVSFRNDKGGVLHAPFGKVSFGAEKLFDNYQALIKAIQSSKPASSKGKFIKKISISSSMGVGVSIPSDEMI